MDILVKIKWLLKYYAARGVGHTSIEIDGLKSVDPALVVENKNRKEFVETSALVTGNIEVITLERLFSIKPGSRAIILDNCLLVGILADAKEKIESLSGEVDETRADQIIQEKQTETIALKMLEAGTHTCHWYQSGRNVFTSDCSPAGDNETAGPRLILDRGSAIELFATVKFCWRCGGSISIDISELTNGHS